MKSHLAVTAVLLLLASANADALRKLARDSDGKTTKPCVWVEGALRKGCFYSDSLLLEGVVAPSKLSTWQAKSFFEWVTVNSKSMECADNKNKTSCESDTKFPCMWYPAGGNHVSPPGKPSCDLHPLTLEYKYYFSMKHACPGSIAAFDSRCVLEGRTKKACSKITSNGFTCQWKVKLDGTPVRSFPCGIPGLALKKLTKKQKKLVPSFITDQHVTTASQKDFEAVYGKCAKSLVTFQNQVCGNMNAKGCKFSKWCLYDPIDMDCDNSPGWWFKNGLGGDAYLTHIISTVQKGCAAQKSAAKCADYSYVG